MLPLGDSIAALLLGMVAGTAVRLLFNIAKRTDESLAPVWIAVVPSSLVGSLFIIAWVRERSNVVGHVAARSYMQVAIAGIFIGLFVLASIWSRPRRSS